VAPHLLVVPYILVLLAVQLVLGILGALGLVEVVVVVAQDMESQPQRSHMEEPRIRTFSSLCLKK